MIKISIQELGVGPFNQTQRVNETSEVFLARDVAKIEIGPSAFGALAKVSTGAFLSPF